MKVRLSLLLCLVAVVTPAIAQQSKTENFPYTGKISHSNVNVRSGPAVDPVGCYECIRLSAPTRVIVRGKNADGTWLKIDPPTGSFSVIRKANVKLDSDGKTGVVFGAERVRVYAGTTMRKVNFSKSQGRLPRGSEVTVLGTITDKSGSVFYKIKPPLGAYLWAHSNFVERVKDAVPTTPKKDNEPKKADDKDKKKEPVESPETTEEIKAAITAIKAMDKQLKAEIAKPIDQRNMLGLLEKYESVKVGKKSYLRGPLDERIRYTRFQIKKQVDAREAEEILKKSKLKRDEIKLKREKIKMTQPDKGSKKPYTAKGVLSASSIFGGNVGQKRYIVRDSKTRRIKAYVECSSGQVDLGDYVDDYVGVVGDVRFDRDLAVNIIDATQVVVLENDVTTRGPAEPVIAPLPKVEPKIEPKTEPKTEPDNEEPTRLIDIGKSEDTESGKSEDDGEKEPTPEPKSETDTEPADPAPIIEIEVEPETPRVEEDEPVDETKAKSEDKAEDKTEAAEEKKAGDSEKSEPKEEPAKPEKEADPADPLPPTGLPVVETEPSKNPVDEKEYQ